MDDALETWKNAEQTQQEYSDLLDALKVGRKPAPLLDSFKVTSQLANRHLFAVEGNLGAQVGDFSEEGGVLLAHEGHGQQMQRKWERGFKQRLVVLQIVTQMQHLRHVVSVFVISYRELQGS